MKLVIYCIAGGVAVLGCAAHSEAEYPDLDTPLVLAPRAAAPPVASEVRPSSATKPRSGSIHRADLTRVVDAGLGRFLQHVEVDASVENGRFQGFRIVRLTPAEFWMGIDLRPGDVVTRINGMSIERPPEAYQAFTALKTAERLVVSYLRQGEPRELVFPIQPALDAPREGIAASTAPGS
jgi:hypothetical protein